MWTYGGDLRFRFASLIQSGASSVSSFGVGLGAAGRAFGSTSLVVGLRHSVKGCTEPVRIRCCTGLSSRLTSDDDALRFEPHFSSHCDCSTSRSVSVFASVSISVNPGHRCPHLGQLPHLVLALAYGFTVGFISRRVSRLTFLARRRNCVARLPCVHPSHPAYHISNGFANALRAPDWTCVVSLDF